MRALVISDIHGNYRYLDKINEDVDVIIVCGDLTDFGSRIQASKAITKLRKISRNILAVPGNCDRPDVNKYLEEEGISLHRTYKEFGDYIFFGLGGSGITPFNTIQEYSEDEIYEMLNETYKKIKDSRRRILVTHTPPYNTRVDFTLSKIHAGSVSVRKFIEENEIYICFCGHIHEARGYDYIKETLIINPGNISRGYVIIDLDKKEFSFKKI